MTKYQIDSREDWLNAAVAELRPAFKIRGYSLPDRIRASVGFPAGRRMTAAHPMMHCWVALNGKDGAYDIFISPMLDKEVEVIGALAHDLVHIAAGIKSGHRAPFQECAGAMGLAAPWTATEMTSSFKLGVAKPVLAAIGAPYPHARLSAADTSTTGRTQGTRLLKCACPKCGYTIRTTRKWLDMAVPECPNPKCRSARMECEDAQPVQAPRRQRA
jgi:hypothetical protein